MTRWIDPDDFTTERPPDVVVAENMARLKTAIPKAERPMATDAATRARLDAFDHAQGFLRLPAGGLISPTLARKLGYVERKQAPAAGPAIDDADAEARSMEEMRHG